MSRAPTVSSVRSAGDVVAPTLQCEVPAADGMDYAHNELSVRGWALGVRHVKATVGTVSAAPVSWLESPDVHERFPDAPGSERARFEIVLPTAGCQRGMHTVTVVAMLADGRELKTVRTVTIEPYEAPCGASREELQAGGIAMSCDMPALGEVDELVSPFSIRGWCYSIAGVDRVQAFLDGRRQYDAIYPCIRLDVGDHVGLGDARLSGFELPLEPEDCPLGEHALTITVTQIDGRTVGQSGIFRCVERSRASRNGAITQQVPTDSGEALGTPERFVPELEGGSLLELDHRTRYRWAAPLANGRSVLDAACGTGYGTAILARAGACRAVGVDISAAALDSARSRAGELAEFVSGDVYELPFDDGEFDVVVCFETIEHVSDPKRALDELRRVLASDGILAISTPHRPVYSAVGPMNPWHRRELTLDELERALVERFQHVRVWGQDSYFTSAAGRLESIPCGDEEFKLAADARTLEPLSGHEPMFAVAIASDLPLPELPGVLFVGPATQLTTTMMNLELRARVAEKHVTASLMESNVVQAMYRSLQKSRFELERDLAQAEARAAAAQRLLQGHRNSMSWRLTRPLRKAKRVVRRYYPA